MRTAVREAIARTGGTVTKACMILAGMFAVLARAANNNQTHRVGFGVAGILMDTFLIGTLLIPVLVVRLSRWNWWPAPLFRRVASPAALEARADQIPSSRPPERGATPAHAG